MNHKENYEKKNYEEINDAEWYEMNLLGNLTVEIGQESRTCLMPGDKPLSMRFLNLPKLIKSNPNIVRLYLEEIKESSPFYIYIELGKKYIIRKHGFGIWFKVYKDVVPTEFLFELRTVKK